MKTVYVASALFLSLASCAERNLTGSGKIITESRPLNSFTVLELEQADEVEILPGTTPRVEISGYENLVPEYESSVASGALRLGYKEGVGNIRNSNIRVRVYTPGVEEIELAGSGDVTVAAGATVPVRKIAVAGAGDVTLRQVAVPQLEIEIAGAGKVFAREASAARVKIEIAGAGDVETTATERVTADIAGAGTVHVWGGAQVEKTVAGAGEIVRH